MRDREPLLATGLVALVLVLWLGFLVHRDPRFAGSGWGGVLGTSGAALLVVSAAYTPFKRVKRLREWATRRTSMTRLLDWHMYIGILGAVLGLLHTGHKFDSALGVMLTAALLVAVLSGYAARYFMKWVSLEVAEKRELLAGLESSYREAAGELAGNPAQMALARPWSALWSWSFGRLLANMPSGAAAPALVRATDIAESIADVEYAIASHERLRRWFFGWLWVHVAASVALYFLLAVHVWCAVRLGLRWFS
jgi:hypothetical protein